MRSLDLAGHVRLVPATYAEEELAPWFLAATAFCSPSHLGLSIFHAFAYGLPVITGDDFSRHPPEARALLPGENGLLFSHGDPVSLAGAILSIIGDDDLAMRLSRGADEAVAERYTLQAMVDGFAVAIHRANETDVSKGRRKSGGRRGSA